MPPSRRAIGLALAVVIHLLLGYALVSGLARQAVDLIRTPLEVTLADDAHTAPDKTPSLKPLPVPKSAPPPLPQPILQPAPAKPQTLAPTPAPSVAKPTLSAETVTPPAAAPATVGSPGEAVSAALVCPNHLAVRNRVQYPAKALRMGLNGQVDVEFTVTRAGEVRDVEVVRSSNPVFNAAAAAAAAQLKCTGQGRDLRVRIPFTFRLEN